jgi:two-component system OmpR family sensor kinase
MHIRLFWKILFSFWLTFICIVEGVWIIFSINDSQHPRPWEVKIQRSVADVQLNSARSAFILGGIKGLKLLRDSWPESDAARLSFDLESSGKTEISQAHNQTISNTGQIYHTTATRSNGSQIRLNYDTTELVPHHKPGPFNIPPELAILGLLGGLLFSSLLAWYLTAPVWRLRMGFEKLAEGVLDIRLGSLMGRRRDEIADLARDFDKMACRMESIVKSRERLLHDVSHELRSPLARQHIAIGLARQSPARTPVLLDRIEKESSRMDDLVGELLTLSRAEYENRPLDEYFDLEELIKIIVNNSRFEAAQDEIEINFSAPLANENVTIKGDAELMRRALENVIRNAIRHTPSGTSVDVALEIDKTSSRCSIKISDHGPGIPADSSEEIFEPFVRLGQNKSHGSGLGLSIAKRAVTAHNGTINASTDNGSGLTITMTLAVEPEEEQQ